MIDDAAMAPTLELPHGSVGADHDWTVGDGRPGRVIVGPLDGSDPSRSTTAMAAGLARRLGWRLALVPVPLGATARTRRDRLVAAAVDERAELVATPATDSIGAAACLALANEAPCPVLAVPLTGRTQPTFRGSIVCGIEDSAGAQAVARTAAHLAQTLGARLELVHAATLRDSRTRREAGACRGLLWRALRTLDTMPPIDIVVEHGEPARRLCALTEGEGTLLVIGAPASAAGDGERERGVASTVLAQSRVPVVLVPAPAAGEAGGSVRGRCRRAA